MTTHMWEKLAGLLKSESQNTEGTAKMEIRCSMATGLTGKSALSSVERKTDLKKNRVKEALLIRRHPNFSTKIKDLTSAEYGMTI